MLPQAQKLLKPNAVLQKSAQKCVSFQKSSDAISTDCECAMAAAASSLTTCTHTAFELTSL